MEFLESLVNAILDWLKAFLDWLLEWPKKVLVGIIDAIGEFLGDMQAPEFFGTLSSHLHSIPPEVSHGLYVLAVPEGLTMVIVAVFSRFVLRRIPFIG